MPRKLKKTKKSIQLKQKQVVNIYTGSVRKSRAPLSKSAKPMPTMSNMPTFNPISYRVQPVGTQTVELERRMNDEIKNLKTELSTLSAELKNPLKQTVIPEQFNQIKETLSIPETPKKKTLAKMNVLELRIALTEQGISSDGKSKKDMIELLKRYE